MDNMAAEGAKFTSAYVPAPICTPSRAGLLTGCYPQRVGLPDVLFPDAERGLDPEERTLGTLFDREGYATACIGKWHLGDREQFLPTNHGFDTYFGIPYSNDMRPNNIHGKDKHPPLPVFRDTDIVERGPDQRTLTRRYTEEAVEFIEDNQDEPFFVYLAHTMPHVPLYASERFEGTSARGLYGDVIEELDWSVGRILDTLDRLGIDDDTLVVFTSDNGPWLEMGASSGSSGPLRGGKHSTWEGGVRVPMIARWPGEIPAASVCTELFTTMDFLPTFASLLDAEDALPDDRIVDGEDATELFFNPENATTPTDYFYYYYKEELEAVRDAAGHKLDFDDGTLYDLRTDVGEERGLDAGEHAATVERLRDAAMSFDADLDEHARGPGRVDVDS
jgi:arylsulfatase A-like enzyme